MEDKIYLFKKPPAGAAQIWIFTDLPPLKTLQIFGRGGFVRKSCDIQYKIIRKNGWKSGNCPIFEKKIFMNFKDVMQHISLDENTSLRSVLNNVSCSKDLYSKKLNKPYYFVHIVKKRRFLGYFWLSRWIFVYLVKKT